MGREMGVVRIMFVMIGDVGWFWGALGWRLGYSCYFGSCRYLGRASAISIVSIRLWSSDQTLHRYLGATDCFTGVA